MFPVVEHQVSDGRCAGGHVRDSIQALVLGVADDHRYVGHVPCLGGVEGREDTCRRSSGSAGRKANRREPGPRNRPSWIGFHGFGALTITWGGLFALSCYLVLMVEDTNMAN